MHPTIIKVKNDDKNLTSVHRWEEATLCNPLWVTPGDGSWLMCSLFTQGACMRDGGNLKGSMM